VTNDDTSLQLAELIDREKIRDCLQRYATGIDRCDADMVLSSYWPDAHDQHGDFDGNAVDFVEWVMPLLRKLIRTQHALGIGLIRIEGRFAKVQTYAQMWHTFRSAAGQLHDVIQGGRYLDKFEKRGNDWRVSDRIVMFDWIMENPKSVDFSHGVLGQERVPVSKRKPDDALYEFLGDLSLDGCLNTQKRRQTLDGPQTAHVTD
jgi:hypothetical protein